MTTRETYNMARIESGAIKPEDITEMVTLVQEQLELPLDGYCGPKTVEALRALKAPPTAIKPTNFVDRRQHSTRRHVLGARPWKHVTGICLHQTACNMGERDERYDNCGAHFVVTRAGKVIQLHELTDLVAHGNGWNNQTVGIEIDGLYAGIAGNQATVWDDPSTPTREKAQTLTPAAVEAAKDLIDYIRDAVKAQGGLCTKLVAHRQSSENRRNDPGSEIWQQIALPMMGLLAMDDGGPGFKIGTGLPIPEDWNPERRGFKY